MLITLTILLTALMSFSIGWYMKHTNILNSIELILNDLSIASKKHKQQIAEINILFNMTEHKEQIQNHIFRLSDKQKEVRLILTELENEYLDKKRFIENNTKATLNSQERLEKLKSKTTGLHQ